MVASEEGTQRWEGDFLCIPTCTFEFCVTWKQYLLKNIEIFSRSSKGFLELHCFPSPPSLILIEPLAGHRCDAQVGGLENG